NVLVEIEERFGESSIEELAQMMRAMGFQGYFIDHGALRDVTEFDPQRMQRAEDIAGYGPGLPRTRFAAYVNNFIFIHASQVAATVSSITRVLARERAA